MTDRPDWYRELIGALPRMRDTMIGRLVPTAEAAAASRASAVLCLFGEGAAGPDVLLTQRSATLRSHAGQVAFPGGRIDPDDHGPAAAALREAREETGLDPGGVGVDGLGPVLWVPPSNNVVTPVVAWWHAPSPVHVASPVEVVAVQRVPLADLVDPQNRFVVRHPSGYAGPGFDAGGLFVWGFTAGVLGALLQLAGLERPWDTGRSRPLPELPERPELPRAQETA